MYAVDAFFYAIFRRPQLLFLVGTSCSNETKAVIQVADYYNLILVSMIEFFLRSILNIRYIYNFGNEYYSFHIQLHLFLKLMNHIQLLFVFLSQMKIIMMLV